MEATEARHRPHARDDVVFRRVDEDWLLFDPVAQEIHVLNLSAALTWSFCDGRRTEAEIAREVARAFEAPPEVGPDEGGEPDPRGPREPPPEVRVREILRRFRAAGLLEGSSA